MRVKASWDGKSCCQGEMLAKMSNYVQQNGQVPPSLARTASREQDKHAIVFRKPMPLEELVPRKFFPHHRGQRMTYICRIHSMLPKPGLLKGEKTQELIDKLANGFHSSLTPGPNLGR